jgi:hypothetical protein
MNQKLAMRKSGAPGVVPEPVLRSTGRAGWGILRVAKISQNTKGF